MANYKLIEVIKTEEKETQSIYDRDDLNTAITDMHNDFGGNLKLETTIGIYCIVIDNTTGAQMGRVQWGDVIRDRVYTHNDATDDNIAAYDSEKLSIANYNTKLAGQRKTAGCTHAVTVRLDGIGKYADADVWNK